MTFQARSQCLVMRCGHDDNRCAADVQSAFNECAKGIHEFFIVGAENRFMATSGFDMRIASYTLSPSVAGATCIERWCQIVVSSFTDKTFASQYGIDSGE